MTNQEIVWQSLGPNDFVNKRVRWREYEYYSGWKWCEGEVLKQQYEGSNYLIVKRDGTGTEISICYLKLEVIPV